MATKRKTTSGRNGHDTSPYAGVMDPIAVNQMQRLVANISSMPADLLRRGPGSDPRRDIDDECGYPKVLTIRDYWEMYDRNPVAKRVNNVLPKECWQVHPEVRESEDTGTEQFEGEFQGLDGQLQGEDSHYESRDGKTSLFFDVCRRADEACGIGSFGITLIGLDDAKKTEGGYRGLEEPVQGFGERNSVPVKKKEDVGTNLRNTPGRWKLTVNEEETEGRKLLFLEPFDESVVTIAQFENNPTSPRYGKPVMYQIDVNTTSAGSLSAMGMPIGSFQVHWTRAVHHLDNPENSRIFGVSRQHTVWNYLYDIRKIMGAAGEGFYKNALMRIFFETHPQLGGDVEVDDDQLRNMMENMENGLQRYGRLSGMAAHPVAPSVTDPTPHIKANIDGICLVLECPVPVFLGYEIGEQASTENRVLWNSRVAGRQNGHCTVRIAVPIIDRLIQVGVLSKPKKRYTLVWPDIETLSEDAAATVANKWVDFLTKYIAGGVENLMDPLDALTRLARMPEEEAEAILNRTLKWIEYNKWSKMTLEDVELEPVEEWPGEVPVGAGEDSGVAVGHVQEGEQPPPPIPGQEGLPGEQDQPPGEVPPQLQPFVDKVVGEEEEEAPVP